MESKEVVKGEDKAVKKRQSGPTNFQMQLAYDCYEDILKSPSARAVDKLKAADALRDAAGQTKKADKPEAHLHFNIPPEYMGKVIKGLGGVAIRDVTEENAE